MTRVFATDVQLIIIDRRGGGAAPHPELVVDGEAAPAAAQPAAGPPAAEPDLGFGRIVASEIEAPIMSAIPV